MVVQHVLVVRVMVEVSMVVEVRDEIYMKELSLSTQVSKDVDLDEIRSTYMYAANFSVDEEKRNSFQKYFKGGYIAIYHEKGSDETNSSFAVSERDISGR